MPEDHNLLLNLLQATMLRSSAKNGDLEAAREMLESNASVNAVNAVTATWRPSA
jgi:hypothetical protein